MNKERKYFLLNFFIPGVIHIYYGEYFRFFLVFVSILIFTLFSILNVIDIFHILKAKGFSILALNEIVFPVIKIIVYFLLINIIYFFSFYTIIKKKERSVNENNEIE